MSRCLIALSLLALVAPGALARAQPMNAPGALLERSLGFSSQVSSDVEHQDRRILVMLQMAPEHYRASSDYGTGGEYGDATAARARRRLAARLARAQGLRLDESWSMPILGIDCVVMNVPGFEPLEAVTERMSRQPGVAWSQPLNEFQAQAARELLPNDRLFAAQPSALEWRLAALHRVATGQGVKVAIIDSMIDAAHPDLKGRITSMRDFVGGHGGNPEQHGTGVAGIIGARDNNGLGIVGVAPAAQLIGLRACWQKSAASTVCDSLSLARALTYAIESGAQIVNMSLSGPNDLLLTKLINEGLRRHVSIVAAAETRSGAGFPASLPGVIAVSQEGLAVSRPGLYTAPGRDVPTTEPGGRWYLVSGNSYAAAHVSGLVALVRQLNAGKVTQLLVAARPDGGAINACETITRAARRHEPACPF